MLIETFCLFAVTFAIALLLIANSVKTNDAVVERVLDDRRRQAIPIRQMLEWRALAARIGRPDRGKKKREQLRTSFIRAGIRSPGAENVFAGLKVAGAVAGAALLCGLAFARSMESSRVVMAAMAGVAGGYLAPDEILKMRIRRRKARIEKALPNTLDLLTICVEAGLGLDQAIVHVAGELAPAYPDISDEFSMISLELRAGKRRSECLRALGERTGIKELKKLTAVLIQADRFGTSIAQSLRVHSEHLRTERRQTAEEKAAKLGVKLVFPIFFFILPSLFVVTVGPVLVRIFEDLIPMMKSF
jgi:tight adherence protein C